ncbi:hypoxanthine-DNA glycosylase [Inhella inkyongensis]|uniref:Hypoxanthine-DNA glycosylase n=1 Tax=Inhella inkyongensis TaxID=392593 RepID=A0A840S3B6_9BURK|nr:DNA-deoxyinosine glycosylase [Inhella inkyongensis]MBB5204223.1 hypoxanthine-DNA glycosylase [Inhella inkyongensis]
MTDSSRLSGLAPVWRPDAELLILGSFPGVASLQAAQYYAHPRNAFWPILGEHLGRPDLALRPYEERLEALIEARIALWDAVGACERQGSLDSAIRAAQPSDLADLVARLPALRGIACNGATAWAQTCRSLPGAPWPILSLPSTSPAHAGLSRAKKSAQWQAALQRLRGAIGVSGTG